MPATPKYLTQQEAIELVRESMAFKGDFAQWLEDQITADLQTQTFAVDLPPIKAPSELIASFSSRGVKLVPRFGDSIRGGRPTGAKSFRVRESSDCAFVLISNNEAKSNWGVELEINSGAEGEIVTLKESGSPNDLPSKRIHIFRFKAIKHCPMVGWYDPGQLARTAVDVVVSTLFGRHADYRLMEALVSASDTGAYDHSLYWKNSSLDLEDPDLSERDVPDPTSKPHEDIWLDYVGDVGDGWNSTYGVAYQLSQPYLDIKNPFDGGTCRTKRGDILVFGGDQVYPVANRQQYRERLTQPYETAFGRSNSPHPHAYAIPGNHDWYDSLVSFTRLFCQRRWFGGWQTNQTRSYFALKLPGRWWLLGTDVQLNSDVDIHQVEYFRSVAQQMEEGDHVIICTAEPHWVYAALYGKDDSDYNENNLAFLEKKVIGDKAKVAAFIAGDEHHYRRYEGVDGTQKITAGGGGAFLHPTHGTVATRLAGGFQLKQSYPQLSDSKKQTFRDFGFLFINPKFGVLTAGLYLLTAWAGKTGVGRFGLSEIDQAMLSAVTSLQNPAAFFWALAMVLGFAMFTDTHKRWYRWVAGILHGTSHLFATFFIGWWAGYVALYWFGWEFNSFSQLFFSAICLIVLGWIVGSTIMGIYLFISLNVFGRQANEAFSALKIPDFKNFLRIRIEQNGDLTIFPVGIRRVPRKWKRRREGTDGSAYVPDDNDATAPELIERPLYFNLAATPGRLSVVNSAARSLSDETTSQ